MPRLILFDIDNTLLYTGGAGGLAMTIALQEMFGVKDGFAQVEFSGRTDVYILSEGLRQHGITGGYGAHLEDFLLRYNRLLERTLRECKGHLMPGFPQLLEALAQRDGIRIGLATGNFRQAAWMKVEHYGIKQYFSDGVFGEASLDRSEMVRSGIREMTAGIPSEEVLIVGDTPHDVSSALDNGLTAVGVATGGYSVDQLRDSGAQMIFPDFSGWQAAATKLSGEA